ncbi:hypothetical protein SD81_026170 [Tolypothrix campylonemoides VB511288]|nr:hypothetical protein SD81_026170 [Tolypothrix campylonemoides VB511288]
MENEKNVFRKERSALDTASLLFQAPLATLKFKVCPLGTLREQNAKFKNKVGYLFFGTMRSPITQPKIPS